MARAPFAPLYLTSEAPSIIREARYQNKSVYKIWCKSNISAYGNHLWNLKMVLATHNSFILIHWTPKRYPRKCLISKKIIKKNANVLYIYQQLSRYNVCTNLVHTYRNAYRTDYISFWALTTRKLKLNYMLKWLPKFKMHIEQLLLRYRNLIYFFCVSL